MAAVVRTPIGPEVRLPTRRTLDERVFVRSPGLFTALSRAVLRLPPRARLRRAFVRRSVLVGWGAWARGDLEVMLLRWAPDCQLELLPELVAAGMRSTYRGHAGICELAADWRDTWEENIPFPQEIIDVGNPIIALGHLHLRARGSGVEFDLPIAFVWWFERGLIVRQRDFSDWEEALRAAGIAATTESRSPSSSRR
jgi:ketosteroid isomerase-like protein